MVLIFVLMNRCYLFNRWFNQSETRMRRVYKHWLEFDLSGTMTVREFDQSGVILPKTIQERPIRSQITKTVHEIDQSGAIIPKIVHESYQLELDH